MWLGATLTHIQCDVMWRSGNSNSNFELELDFSFSEFFNRKRKKCSVAIPPSSRKTSVGEIKKYLHTENILFKTWQGRLAGGKKNLQSAEAAATPFRCFMIGNFCNFEMPTGRGWWWSSSGQRARLLLRRSEFECDWCLSTIYLWKWCWKERK